MVELIRIKRSFVWFFKWKLYDGNALLLKWRENLNGIHWNQSVACSKFVQSRHFWVKIYLLESLLILGTGANRLELLFGYRMMSTFFKSFILMLRRGMVSNVRRTVNQLKALFTHFQYQRFLVRPQNALKHDHSYKKTHKSIIPH